QGVNNDGAPGCNNGTFKFNFEYAVPHAQITTNTTSGCTPLTVSFVNTSVSAVQYLWDFGNNDTTSLINNPVRTFTTPGTYTVILSAKNSACFDVWDSAFTIITVHPKPIVAYTPSIVACTDTFNFINNSTIVSGTMNYAWAFGDGTATTVHDTLHAYASLGTYTTSLVVTSDKGCMDSLKIPVQTTVLPDSVGIGTAYCPESIHPYQLYAEGGTSYQWLPAAGLSSTTISNPVASPTVTTNYSVTITETDWGGNTCASVDTVRVTIFPGINADFNLAVNNCGNTVTFTDNSASNPAHWSWYFNDGDSSHVQNPQHSYALPGTYS